MRKSEFTSLVVGDLWDVLALLTFLVTPVVVVVARVPEYPGVHSPHFRRGDFSCNWQSNPRPGKTRTSYNFGAAGRANTMPSCGMSEEPDV